MFGDLMPELDRLVDVDPASCTDAELAEAVVAGRACVDRLRAIVAVLTGEWDQRAVWAGDGARNGGAWLGRQCNMNPDVARAEVRDARCLRSMPASRRAVLRGDITLAHVRVLSRLCRRRTAWLFERDEKILVDFARTLSWRAFTHAVHYWEQHADPDGTDLAAEERRAKRTMGMSTSLAGDLFGEFRLEALAGATFRGVFDAIEQELWEADWADARGRCGEAASLADIARTPQQRRADALVEMAVRAATAPKDGQRPRPTFSILCDYPTVAGRLLELFNGAVVTPGQVAPLLSEADVERVVFDGPSRVIDLGRRRRFFRGGARRAVELRDQTCQGFACDAPADRCDVDHVQPWEHGGPTDHDNGQLHCRFHHRDRHRRDRSPPGEPDDDDG